MEKKLRGMASQIFSRITKNVKYLLQMDFSNEKKKNEDAESDILPETG